LTSLLLFLLAPDQSGCERQGRREDRRALARRRSPGVGTGWGWGKLCGPNDTGARTSARTASKPLREERPVDNKSDRRHGEIAMRSLWPSQPQRVPEAGPFAVRMQSFFPSNLSSQRSHISLSLAGLFLNSSKLFSACPAPSANGERVTPACSVSAG
jgi:hypothetical protein